MAPSPEKVSAAKLGLHRELILGGGRVTLPETVAQEYTVAVEQLVTGGVATLDGRTLELPTPRTEASEDARRAAHNLLYWLESKNEPTPVEEVVEHISKAFEFNTVAISTGVTYLREHRLVTVVDGKLIDNTGIALRKTDRANPPGSVALERRNAKRAVIRRNYDKLMALETPTWFEHISDSPFTDSRYTEDAVAVIREQSWDALTRLAGGGKGERAVFTDWMKSIYPDYYEAIIARLAAVDFITVTDETVTVSTALPSESRVARAERVERERVAAEKKAREDAARKEAERIAAEQKAREEAARKAREEAERAEPAPAPAPEPEQKKPEPKPTRTPTFTDEERDILLRAARQPSGVRLMVAARDQPTVDGLVARGHLEKDAEDVYRYRYAHPSDAELTADDLTTVRNFTASVIKKLTEEGRDSLDGLDKHVTAELRSVIERRLDGVLIANDGSGRWSLIGGKPRLTRAQQRARAEEKAQPKPKPKPEPVPEHVPAGQSAAVRIYTRITEVDRKIDALLTAHSVRPVVPNPDPRAASLDDVVWRIAVVLQAIGPSLMSTVTAGYLTSNQRQWAKRALARGLADGVFEEVPGLRKSRIKVVAPPAGRTWDELHAAAERINAAQTAKRITA